VLRGESTSSLFPGTADLFRVAPAKQVAYIGLVKFNP